MNWGTDVVKFGAQNVLFSMLVASNLAPWGPSIDAGGLGSTRKETLGFQAWISIDFGVHFGFIFLKQTNQKSMHKTMSGKHENP